ncbi:hypothetical protein DEU56DRAFT_773107 [Suillus clintonianus]|uniref:uncharacterized protein n=1 Tax=Suillus clintonianus TaxID=1904413 RepID=UPI001B862D6E|nr:uncharacterized protein DEU56DRAFT_773107 [Suillus clintonianus]KAG2154102.1 hypothetical protein DEU56DRAFT_773107 [Suillus clintonianus]
MPLVAATGNYTPFRHTQLIQVDTAANIIPLTFNYMSAEVRDPTTNLQVGTAYFGKDTLPAKPFEDPGPAQLLVYCIERLRSNV